MTRLVRHDRGTGHSYTLDGESVLGVTKAISDGYPPKLDNWAARTVAVAAVEQRDEWEQLGSSYAQVEWLRQRPYQKRDTAAVRGNRIHSLAHRLQRGESVDVPDELVGHVDACLAFLRDFQVETLAAEIPVAHTGERSGVPVLYAGTLDLICRIGTGMPVRWLLDWKTGTGVYGSTALQLAAYRFCDLALIDGADAAMPKVDQCGVVHLRADGYDLYPVQAGEREWRTFLHVVAAARFREVEREMVGASVHPEEVAS